MLGRRGFTLIETLVVLAVLAIIAAIAAPSLLGRRAPVHFDNALDRTRSALTMARARAMEEGAPVSVYASGLGDAGPVRLFMTGRGRGEENGGTRRTEEPVDPMSLHALPEDDDDDGWTRTLIDLPPGVRLVREEEVEQLAAAAAAAGDPDPEALALSPLEAGVEAREERHLLTAFLPDGSAVASSPGVLIGGDGQVARIHVSTATGVATIERLGLLSTLEEEEEAETEEMATEAEIERPRDADAAAPGGGVE